MSKMKQFLHLSEPNQMVYSENSDLDLFDLEMMLVSAEFLVARLKSMISEHPLAKP